MDNIRIAHCTITDRNGNQVEVREPLFGRLTYSDSDGRPKIVRKTWWGISRILIPALEDRIDLDIRDN